MHRGKWMSSNRSFWIIIRIAVAEGAIIFGLLMYILQLNSVISSTFTWSLPTIFTLIAMVLLAIAERKYKNTN